MNFNGGRLAGRRTTRTTRQEEALDFNGNVSGSSPTTTAINNNLSSISSSRAPISASKQQHKNDLEHSIDVVCPNQICFAQKMQSEYLIGCAVNKITKRRKHGGEK
jgi:hypothetical protein